jgi:hypothetical protein
VSGAAEIWLVYAIGIAVWAALFVVPLWKLCTRLGHSGWWSLVSISGVGLVLLLFVLAFGGPHRDAIRAEDDSFDGWT